jgi:hypothetical protein
MKDDRKDWIRLARKVRLLAKQMTQADTRREMLAIAVAYRQLAEWSERSQPVTFRALRSEGRSSEAKTGQRSPRQQNAS